MSSIAETARLEAATETLAEYIGYLNGEIDAELESVNPNRERVSALEHELGIVLGERRSVTPDAHAIISRALYIYAPRLKAMHCEASSGNVFADLGLPDADTLKIKSGLVIEITQATRSLGLTQEAAATRMGITPPEAARLARGEFDTFTVEGLRASLARLQR